MKIILMPQRRSWQVWKRPRQLQEGKDYITLGETIIMTRKFNGKIEFIYVD